MHAHPDALALLLLDLLSPRRAVAVDQVAALAPQDWAALLEMVRQHRLGPLLHWRLTRQRQDLPVPEAVREALAQAFRQSAMRSLVLQKELLQVHRQLQAVGIAHVALKGAFLAFHAYEHPALRPLRDLDILVPEAQALAAFGALLDQGAQRIAHYDGNLQAVLEHQHHLPPLRGATGQVNIEVHARLFHRDHDTPNPQADLSEDAQFWARTQEQPIAGERMAFESPTDLLLHLIVHAVYDHQFNNGPLVLSDLACLLARHPIDWPLFWQLAEQGRHTRGCALALQLTEHYWGPQAIVWPEGAQALTQDAPLQEAAVLMLRDFDARGDVTLGHAISSQGSWGDRLKLLGRKLVPSKTAIAAQYPVSANSVAVYGYYLIRWWRLLTRRLPAYVLMLRQPQLQAEVSQMGQLNRWLLRTGEPKGAARHGH